MQKDYEWCSANSKEKTHPVGGKKPNSLGLYDMLGNVKEWCSDWYDEGYYKICVKENPKSYEDTISYNPSGPAAGKYKVARGDFWFGGIGSTYRTYYAPASKKNFIGFRCVMDGNGIQKYQ